MARTSQSPRNLPNTNGNNGDDPAIHTQTAVDADRLAKARAARSAVIPPEERALIETADMLRKQRDEAPDEGTKAEISRRLASIEAQRKSLAFVRKAGDTLFEVQELAKKLKSLAGSNYRATDAQRNKVKLTYSTILSEALGEFDRAAPDTQETDAKSRKTAARQAAAAMFKA